MKVDHQYATSRLTVRFPPLLYASSERPLDPIAMSFLALPFELRTTVYKLTLIDPSESHLHLRKPEARFAYETRPWETRDSLARLEQHGRLTRSAVKALLPQRPRNPYHSRTGASLLLVCRQTYNEGSAIYYGKNTWEICIHGRNPSVTTFRAFLDTIGARNRGFIHTVVLLSLYGYNHMMEGPPSGLVCQLQRCYNLRIILISMTSAWAKPLKNRRTYWEDRCLIPWKKQIESLEAVDVWDQGHEGSFVPDLQIFINNLLKKKGFVPERSGLQRTPLLNHP